MGRTKSALRVVKREWSAAMLTIFGVVVRSLAQGVDVVHLGGRDFLDLGTKQLGTSPPQQVRSETGRRGRDIAASLLQHALPILSDHADRLVIA